MPYEGSYVQRVREKVGHDLLLLPAAIVVVLNEKGEVLLQRRTDTGEWSLIGGIAEENSSFMGTAVSELKEEAGIDLKDTGLYLEPFGAMSDPAYHCSTYPNGDKVHCFSLCFLLRGYEGKIPASGDENDHLNWFPLMDMPKGLNAVSEEVITLLITYLGYKRFLCR